MARVRKEAYDNRVDADRQKGGIPPGNYYINPHVGVPIELINPGDSNTPLLVAPLPCPDDTDLTVPSASRLSADKRHQSEWIVHVTGVPYVGDKGKSISFLIARSSDRDEKKNCPYTVLFNALSALKPRKQGAAPPAIPSNMSSQTLMYLQSLTERGRNEGSIIPSPTDLYFFTGAVYRLGANQPIRGKKETSGSSTYIPSCNGPAPLGMNPGDSLPVICLKGQVGIRLFDLLDKQRLNHEASNHGEFLFPHPTGVYTPGKGLIGGNCFKIWRPKESIPDEDRQLQVVRDNSTWGGKLPANGIAQGYEVFIQNSVIADPKTKQASRIAFTEEQVRDFMANRAKFALGGQDDQTDAEIPGYLRFMTSEEKASLIAQALVNHPLALKYGWEGTSFWTDDIKGIISRRKSSVGDPAASTAQEVPPEEQFPTGGDYVTDEFVDPAEAAVETTEADPAAGDEQFPEQDENGILVFPDGTVEGGYAEDTMLDGATEALDGDYAVESEESLEGEVDGETAEDTEAVEDTEAIDQGEILEEELPTEDLSEENIDTEPLDDETTADEQEAVADLKSAAAAATQHIKPKPIVAPPPKPKTVAAPPAKAPVAKAPVAPAAKAPAAPAAKAPVAKPPVAPAAKAPVSPAAKAPVAPAAKAPGTPATKAPAAKLPAAKPPVAKPPAAKPPVAKPPAAKPPAAKPPDAKPPTKK